MDKRSELCNNTIVQFNNLEKLNRQIPKEEVLIQLSDLYKMFSDYTMVKILWTLGYGEQCVNDIAVLLGMTNSAISHQLQLLRLSKLVSFHKKGKKIYYSLIDDLIKDILFLGFGHINE